MNNPMTRRAGWIGLCMVGFTLLALSGCEQPPPVVDGPTAEALAALRYPGLAEYGPDLDIIVIREGDHISLTNRTARSYTGMQLWLNQQYVSQVESVGIGVNPDQPLAGFLNRHREEFPVGSFLQPDQARPVISAELYDPAANVRYRLTVQPDDQTLHL
jgi:hypothetical protein